ncbi:MAG: DJ-1/PfpI family protein [Chromatiales bacterium]|nr:DJ-1/PfpI family protein [Chromatiales bacterium]
MSSDKPLQGKRVAVLVESEYIADEVEVYRSRFPELGAEVHFMANLWGAPEKRMVCDIDSPDTPVSRIHTMLVDRDVSDARADDYDIVIQTANYTSCRLREIPPMGSLGSPEETHKAPAVQFFADAMRNKRIVKGAMCHALWILTPCPELLAGRRVICHTVVLADIHNAGATFVADPGEVVVDDDLVTARSFANMEAYFEAIVQLASSR